MPRTVPLWLLQVKDSGLYLYPGTYTKGRQLFCTFEANIKQNGVTSYINFYWSSASEHGQNTLTSPRFKKRTLLLYRYVHKGNILLKPPCQGYPELTYKLGTGLGRVASPGRIWFIFEFPLLTSFHSLLNSNVTLTSSNNDSRWD